MTKEDFRNIAKRYLYLDGATGSNLVKAGMPAGVCPEQWILEHPGALLELQRAYVKAGADILYAPTFTANRVKLSEYGLQDRMREMIGGLVALSREAAAEAAALLCLGTSLRARRAQHGAQDPSGRGGA